MGQRNQDIYNADELDRLLGKTVITRTFEEVTGKDIRRIHQMPIPFLPEEREVYNIVLKEFYRIQREYYSSTGNSRKDALMRLIQQITLLLRISAAPDCMKEYEGETPLKEMAVVEALARWPEEVVAIGVRHTTVLDRYAAAIREYLPDRPSFVVTGSTVTFAKRRALRDVLRDSQNGILLCTQQSLPSSVNFEFVQQDHHSGDALQQRRHEPVLYAVCPLHLHGEKGSVLSHLHWKSGIQPHADGAGKGKSSPCL